MKKILMFSILLIAVFQINAQNHFLGVKGGVSWTNMVSNADNESGYKYRTGFEGGLTYDYIFKNSVTVGADLIYNQRGAREDFILTNELGDPTGQSEEIKSNYDYLSLPLKVGYIYGEEIYAFINIALVPSILLSAKNIWPILDAGEVYMPAETFDITNDVTKFDLAALAEVGVGYKFAERYMAYASFQYQQSFISITNDNYLPNVEMYHNGMALSLGIKYALAKN